jgi:hypothetical protein
MSPLSVLNEHWQPRHSGMVVNNKDAVYKMGMRGVDWLVWGNGLIVIEKGVI